jgi:hypothetical protein
MIRRIIFVSGPVDLDAKEFDIHYAPMMKKAVEEGASFVIGDCQGTDQLAQQYLFFMHYIDVTVYHMLATPRHNVGNFKTVGGFKSDNVRDAAMTKASTEDLAYVRTPTEARARVEAKGQVYDPTRVSGTEKNIIRREMGRMANKK